MSRSTAIRSAARLGTFLISAGVLLSACAANFGGGSNTSLSGATDPANLSTTASSEQPLPAGIAKPSVKIALLLPLSGRGQAGPIAIGLKQAAEMALFEENNPNVQLVVKDTKGTPEGARSAATEAAAAGVELILGPLYGANVVAVSEVARQARVPVVAFSNDRRKAGNGTYLLSFLVEEEVRRIVGYAAGRGKSRFAALIPDNDYGKIVTEALRTEVARAGGRVVALETYPPGTNGMLEPAQRLFEAVKSASEMGASVDAIFLPGGPDTLPNLAPLVRYASVDPSQVKFLGTGGWDYPNIGRDATFVGGWYPSPDPNGWRSFSERFIRAFGSAPPRIATLAHDAVTIAISLAGSHPAGQRYTPQNLTRASGFVGIDGPIRFTAAGTAERGLAVLEVQKFGTQVIDHAPGGFVGPQAALSRTTTSALPSFGPIGQ
jgi:branched-chain amino acid transport system substrate-binding protein